MSLLGSESTESRAETESRPETGDQQERPPKTHSTTFRLARVLFGGVLAFAALDNLRDLEESVEYAESEGAPMAERSVPAVSASLLFGGLGIAAWRLPRLAAGAAAAFLASVTPVMHDFWAVDEEQKEQQLIHFLKNTALFGAALGFLRVGQDD